MKVGKWRRERLGQNNSHTREVVVVLVLILLLGVYIFYGVAETEQGLSSSSDVNPDNILIPMPMNLTVVEYATPREGKSLRGSVEPETKKVDETKTRGDDTRGQVGREEPKPIEVKGKEENGEVGSKLPSKPGHNGADMKPGAQELPNVDNTRVDEPPHKSVAIAKREVEDLPKESTSIETKKSGDTEVDDEEDVEDARDEKLPTQNKEKKLPDDENDNVDPAEDNDDDNL